jgi:hypothetical protein
MRQGPRYPKTLGQRLEAKKQSGWFGGPPLTPTQRNRKRLNAPISQITCQQINAVLLILAHRKQAPPHMHYGRHRKDLADSCC